MTILRILCVLAWGFLLIYMVPGAWSAVRCSDPRRGDPMRLGILLVCCVMVAGNLRFLFVPDNDQLWMAIYGLSFVTACYIIHLARAYGRGPRI